MKLPTATRAEIEAHYHRHAETYQDIWGRLSSIHQRFMSAGEELRKSMLKLSYVNGVISVQCPLHIHEEAIFRLVNGEGLERALESVNYNQQKLKYITETLADDEIWTNLVDMLESEGLDAAHKYALDHLKFVSTVKVPFVFAMLGYCEKMCLDANMCRIMEIDQPKTVVVERYESQCQDVLSHVPTLGGELKPFHVQWLMFDFQRFNRKNMSDAAASRVGTDQQITRHSAWFEMMYQQSEAEIQALASRLS